MSDFFLNTMTTFNPAEKSLGDKLIYYGGVVSTLGSIMALTGSTILYNEETRKATPFEEDAPVTSRQLTEMQQQLTQLQQKIEQLEKDRR
ncbi:hypothetical protein [Oceanobacillus sp. CFH 90083]|uniref:hypothetical protein n=1 Tax=Oceanobacillus sp. CFH 90083 TaxID=2592336 RepID=UPI00128D374C|nr:hypothetical protein [Oceanobacillus sp. CFH 90083]